MTTESGQPGRSPSAGRRTTRAVVAAAAAAVAVISPLRAQDPPAPGAIQERIRVRFESMAESVPGNVGPLRAAGERLHASTALSAFYEGRTFRPAWIGEGGRVPSRATELVRALRGATGHGLRPADYRVPEIDSALAAHREAGGSASVRERAELDLLLTDAFLTYGAHLLSGRIDPRSIDPLWTATGREAVLGAVLQRALEGDSVGPALEGLAPSQREYRILRRTLAEYRAVAETGGWPEVPPGPTLREGDGGERVAALWRRLAASGDLSEEVAESTAEAERFDTELASAVRRFQRRHGLEPDALVGDSTVAALNVPVERRVDQIETNMERWRWMPEQLGERHVRVNIANFEAEVVEGDSTVLAMRAIVGRHYRQTPVFSDTMRYVVLNPSWSVPTSIAVRDILPQVKKSVSYLSKQNMRVFRGWGAEAGPVDPGTIDWASLGRGDFPYRFVQRPGPMNALGQVKFMFPNRFAVYLHDTPARGLFAQNVRSFSSGCIRLERPTELLEYLFRESDRWTPEALRKALENPREQTVSLPEQVPVHLQYWTAWAEEDGTVHFRRDIYGRDARLEKALEAPPPGS